MLPSISTNRCGGAPEYLEYYKLARDLHRDPLQSGAYFGSGGDAESFLHITDVTHGAMLDCLPLEPADAESGVIDLKPLQQTALWRQYQAGTVAPHCNRNLKASVSYSSTSDHQSSIGLCLLGNLQEIGATHVIMNEMNPFRTDFHFQWRHPLADTERPRVLSYLFAPDAAECEWVMYGKTCQQSSQQHLLRSLASFPRFDFAMTRAFHGVRAYAGQLDRVPAFRSVMQQVRPGGLVFSDCAAVCRVENAVPQSVPSGLPQWPHPWNNDTGTVQAFKIA